MSTFVSIGNAPQSFTRLLEGVRRIAAELPQPVVVQHGHSILHDGGCQLVPFMGMEEFIQHINSSELLILHAGAGSLIHAIKAGKIPVVMPRRAIFGEHVDDHQVEFAQSMAMIGKVVVAEGPDDLMKAAEEAMAKQKLVLRNEHSKDSIPPLISIVGRLLNEYAGKSSSEHF